VNWKQISIGVIILGIVGITTWYIIRQYKMLSDYCYSFLKGKATITSIKKVDLSLTFVIKNKSDIGIQITNQKYKIFVNGTVVSNINLPNLISIPAQGYGKAIINASFNPLQVIQTALNSLADLLGNRSNILIDIEGTATAGSGGIMIKELPISYSTNLKELTEDDGTTEPDDVDC
jgi:hypothetical protein